MEEDDRETLMHSDTEGELRAEIARLRAILDAAIRILSNDKLPLQSRVNDARSVLSH